jgi:hypothetical protein
MAKRPASEIPMKSRLRAHIGYCSKPVAEVARLPNDRHRYERNSGEFRYLHLLGFS